MIQKRVSLENLMDMVHEIDKNGEGLTKWEIEFIASFIDHPRTEVTQKQYDIVQRIYDEKVK
jgi:hypothetical protein